MNEADEKTRFNKDLQDYWQQKSITPLKIPQIGGRELDFFTLYRAVCKRGGAEAVSNNKLWKEVVDELRLPPTCTSASYHLKNHYSKYLLGFELKYMQGKDDTSLPVLNPGRQNLGQIPVVAPQRITRNVREEEEGSSEGSESESEPQVESRGRILHPSLVNINTSNLGQELQKFYSKHDRKEEIYFSRKNKLYITRRDIKRITMAFQSRMQEELNYAVNTLLLYSVNQNEHFLFDNAHGLLDGMTKYLEDNIKNLPCLNKAFQIKTTHNTIKKQDYDYFATNNNQVPLQNADGNTENLIQQLNILENFNYSVSSIILFNIKNKVEVSPLKMLQKRKQQNIGNGYDQLGEAQLLEQIRSIFQIFRNLCYLKNNETAIIKNDKLLQLIIQLFLLNSDGEISKSILDIVAIISKHLHLSNIQDHKQFCERIFEVLQADSNEELEAGVETMRHLISIQENEPILENMIESYLDSLTRLLLYSHGEIREGVLEFFCYLSDLKMSTKVILAKQPKLLMRLIGLLGSGVGKQHEKITRMSAHTLNNIVMAPASRQYILPYEKDIFIVAASDEQISKLLNDIVNELYNYEFEEQ